MWKCRHIVIPFPSRDKFVLVNWKGTSLSILTVQWRADETDFTFNSRPEYPVSPHWALFEGTSTAHIWTAQYRVLSFSHPCLPLLLSCLMNDPTSDQRLKQNQRCQEFPSTYVSHSLPTNTQSLWPCTFHFLLLPTWSKTVNYHPHPIKCTYWPVHFPSLSLPSSCSSP